MVGGDGVGSDCAGMSRFRVDAATSSVLVAARSSIGPITFEAREIDGWIDVDLEGAGSELVIGEGSPAAELQVQLTSLRSGNDLYDSELRRRIDARRFPMCILRLERGTVLEAGRFSLAGTITFHGTTRPLAGTVEVEAIDEDRIAVTGAKELDIRDFGLRAPTMLMTKIYPEVQVQLFIAAVADPDPGVST